MSVSYNPAVHVVGEGASATLPYNVTGPNPFLLVAISMLSNAGQEVTLAKWDGLDMVLICADQTQSGLRNELWALTQPFEESNNVNVTFSASCKYIVSAINFIGVDQSQSYYFAKDGVGLDTNSIDIMVPLHQGKTIFGWGAVLGVVGAIVQPDQVPVWNTHNGLVFRSQAVTLFCPVTVTIPVSNKIAKPADWCVQMLGLNPST